MIKTRKEFIKFFRNIAMDNIRFQEQELGHIDYPLRAEAWHNTIDAFVKEGVLPRCAVNWSNPFDRRK